MARTLKGTPPVEPQAFSRKDTGVALGIHERSVDRLVKTGALEAVKLGKGIHCIGVLQGAHPRTDREQPGQVCSVQTLTRRKRLDVDLVLVDEAHGLYRDVLRWMQDCPSVPFVGLSATPWSRGLGKFYDALICAATTADLIRDGFLSPFTVYAPSNPDLSSVATVAGDFKEDELSE